MRSSGRHLGVRSSGRHLGVRSEEFGTSLRREEFGTSLRREEFGKRRRAPYRPPVGPKKDGERELLPSRRMFCVHHTTMHQCTVSLHSKPHT